MLKRLERASKHTEVAVVAATCDRCGLELQRVTGVGVDYLFPFRGIYIRGRLYAKSGKASETKTLEVELCDGCTEELIDWVGSDDLIDREFIYERLERGC